MKHAKFFGILFAFLIYAPSALALSPVNKSLFGGLAIKGYDPVSYFVAGKAQKGKSEFEVAFRGAKWRFHSAENKNAFEEDPAKYVPQYGGYCAWAVAEGYTAKIDPNSWKIVDGKLYLNYNDAIQKKWEEDIPSNIEKANLNWPQLIE